MYLYSKPVWGFNSIRCGGTIGEEAHFINKPNKAARAFAGLLQFNEKSLTDFKLLTNWVLFPLAG